MRFVLGSLMIACASFILLPSGGDLDAGPFFKRRTCPPGGCPTVSPPTSPIATGLLQESKPVESPVQQPWLLNEQTDDTSLQQPDTALEPVPGTGSPSLIGPKVPDKITHILDPATLQAIVAALKGAAQPSQPVPITLPVTEATSQQFSRISMILEVAAWLGTALLGHSLAGRVLPLVAQVGSGLLSASVAASRAAAQAATVPSLPPAIPSPAGTPVAPSSTPTQGT